MTDATQDNNPTEVRFRSDMTVELIKSVASDADVIWAARVSTAGEQSLDSLQEEAERSEGLIRYLVREKHGSPFEHNSFTFFIQAPIFVFREFMRHRVGWSFNEESGRYRQLAPTFYVPAAERPLIQVGKTGHYQFVPGSPEQYAIVVQQTKAADIAAYKAYEAMLDAGVAKEVARTVLPVGTYSSMYTTCNARSLMNFLALRVHDENATFPSYPQREIQMVAEQMETAFAEKMPLTYKAYIDNGRVAP